jgi:hypothetical protein
VAGARAVICLVCCIACGRIGFDPVADGSASARCDWTAGPKLGAVVARTELNSSGQDQEPLLVRGDPLSMYMSSDRNGTYDIFYTQRAALDQPFGPPVPVPFFSTSMAESSLMLDSTGHGYAAIGSPDSNLFEVQRDGAGNFSIVRALSELNTPQAQFDPQPSADGLTLWFTDTNPTTGQDVVYSTRPDIASTWSPPVPFGPGATAGNEGGATLTADETVIVWSGPAAGGQNDIYYAVRPSRTDAWGPAMVLAPGLISSPMSESWPTVREDGCELFFGRCAPSCNDWDLYSVDIAP